MLEALHRHGNGIDVNIYSSFKPIPAAIAAEHARQYALNYSSKPWDIYKLDNMDVLAREKLELISDLLGQKQALLISISKDTQPVGFGFITDMNLFVTALQKKADMLDDNCNQVTAYLKHITREITGSDDMSKIAEIGYIADVVVDEKYHNNGVGKKILRLSLDCFYEEGMKSAIEWTVNPAMSHITLAMGGKLILNVGQEGEALDSFRRDSGVLPFIAKPSSQSVVAEHYLFDLLR